jgi:hypothetical protein
MNAATALFAVAVFLSAHAHALTPAHSPTLQMLRNEASRDVALAAAGDPAKTKANAGAAFDGEKEVPFHVVTLKPVGYVEVPGTGTGEEVKLTKPQEKEQAEKGREKVARDTGEPPAETIKTDDTPDKSGNPSYHFEGRRIPNLNVVTYTPVPDAPGQDGSTEAPKKGGDWRSWAPKLMLGGGVLATIGGFFFPPLLFLGGALLGAWGMLKLISAQTGGD